MRPLPPLDHVAVLTDDVGIIQHAVETVPNRSTGYCTDDVARALMVVLARLRLPPHDEMAERFASTYLAYLEDAQLEDGRFHNFMSYERAWLDDVGTQDSNGRALWGLGYALRYAPTQPWRRVSRKLFDRGLAALDDFDFLRPHAYAALGLAHACAAHDEPAYVRALRRAAGVLVAAYEASSQTGWEWFEPVMTYDNARLPEALIRTGLALDDAEYCELGLRTLRFYERVSFEAGVYVPIGNDGWYPHGGPRARYVQQPLEAFAMVDTELAAFDATRKASHRANADLALAWYYGKNSRGVTMAQGGGCYDGLGESAVNPNMGAESTLALLAAAYAMAERQNPALRAVR